MAQTYAGTNTSSGVRLTTSELAQTSIEARKRWDPNRAAATWPDGPRVQMPSTQEVQLRREAQQGRYTYTQAAQTQPDPAPYEYEQPETLGLYTQELERLKTQLTQAEADMNAAKERSQAADGLVNGTALSGGMVSAESIANANAAREEYQQAQQLYSSLLAQNEELSYAQRMNNTTTDTSQVAALLQQKENYEMAGYRPTEYYRINQQLSDTRNSLRNEGYSDGEVDSLFAYLRREQNAQYMAATRERAYQAAKERGGGTNALINIGAGLGSAAGYIDLAGQNLLNWLGPEDAITGQRMSVDYNTPYQTFYHVSDATMRGELDKLMEKYAVKDENGNIIDMSLEGKIRAGAYQLSVSMGQSAAVIGLTAVGVPGATLLLAGSAGTSTVHEFHQRGFSDGTAFLMGTIAGVAEYATEKIGIDELFKTRDVSTVKNVLRGTLQNLWNQSMAEGGEEVLSTVINTLADIIINGDRNQITERQQELMAAGVSSEEAARTAGKEWLQGLWQDFYMGALSGTLFSLGGTAVQSGANYVQDTQTGRQIISEGNVQALLDAIEQIDGDINAAANLSGSVDANNARAVGSAARALDRAGAMETIRAQLTEAGETNISPALLSGIYAEAQGQRLTYEEQRAVRNSPAASAVAENIAEMMKSGTADTANRTAPTGQSADNGHFSIEVNPDGSQYVKADRQILTGDDPTKWGKQLEQYINEQIRQGNDVTFTTEDGHEIQLTERTAYKMSDRHIPGQKDAFLSDAEYYTKENAAGHLDELVQTALFSNYQEDQNHRHANDIGEDGFNYYTAYFEDGDGKYFRVPISVGINGNGETAYSIGRVRERKTRTGRGSSAQRVRSASDFSGAQNGTGLSANTYTTNASSRQGGKTEMQIALEKALAKKGVTYEQNFDRGQENRNDGIRTGGEAVGVYQQESGGQGTLAGSQSEIRQSVGEGHAENLRQVTPAALGIRGGSNSQTVSVLDTAQLTGEARAAAEQVQRLGLEPVAYQGDLVINGQSANGYIENGRVYFRTDARYSDGTAISPQSIVRHEAVHNAAQQNPGIVEQGMAAVRQLRTEAEVRAMKEAYREAYKKLYDFETMTEAQIEAMIEEELVADAYGKMNYFRDGADTQQAVQAALPQVMGQQTTETAQDTRGPPKASLRVFEDGQRFVEVDIDQKQFDGLSPREILTSAEKIIRNKFMGKVIGSDNRAFVNGKTASEYAHPSKRWISDEVREAKGRVSTELDNLMDAGFNFRTKPDGEYGHVHKNVTGDYNYFDVVFKVGNEYYLGVINIEQNAKGKRLKDVTKIENITERICSSYGQSPKSTSLRDVSMDSIRASAENSNTNFSSTASTGSADTQSANRRGLASIETINRDVIPYADTTARDQAQAKLHNRMVEEGKILSLTQNEQAVEQYYPDLRSMPKKERIAILREKINALKADLRRYLNGLKNVSYEFEINGSTLEARLYGPGVNEAMEKITREKAEMLYASDEIFRNAEYLYSTEDKSGNPDINCWDYFYVPVALGEDPVGVRIAIRNRATTNESQIYNWSIKKDAALGGGGRLQNSSSSTGASSTASKGSVALSAQNSNTPNSANADTMDDATKAMMWEYMKRHGYDKKFRYSRHLYRDYVEKHGLQSQKSDARADEGFSPDTFPDRSDSATAHAAREIQRERGTEEAIDYVAEQFVAGRIFSDEAYQIWQELRAEDGGNQAGHNQQGQMNELYLDELLDTEQFAPLKEYNGDVHVIGEFSENQYQVQLDPPEIAGVTKHYQSNLEGKSDRAMLTVEIAQDIIYNSKLVLYQADRKTLKFLSDDGYVVLSLQNKIVTAVPEKLRGQYRNYLEEK